MFFLIHPSITRFRMRSTLEGVQTYQCFEHLDVGLLSFEAKHMFSITRYPLGVNLVSLLDWDSLLALKHG